MTSKRAKHTCIRVQPVTHDELTKIAESHGMSMLGTVAVLVRLWKKAPRELRAEALTR